MLQLASALLAAASAGLDDCQTWPSPELRLTPCYESRCKESIDVPLDEVFRLCDPCSGDTLNTTLEIKEGNTESFFNVTFSLEGNITTGPVMEGECFPLPYQSSPSVSSLSIIRVPTPAPTTPAPQRSKTSANGIPVAIALVVGAVVLAGLVWCVKKWCCSSDKEDSLLKDS